MPFRNWKFRVQDILEAIEEAQKYPKNMNVSGLAGKLFGIQFRMIFPSSLSLLITIFHLQF